MVGSSLLIFLGGERPTYLSLRAGKTIHCIDPTSGAAKCRDSNEPSMLHYVEQQASGMSSPTLVRKNFSLNVINYTIGFLVIRALQSSVS